MTPRWLVFAVGLALVILGWWLNSRPSTDETSIAKHEDSKDIDRSIKTPEIVSDETKVGLAILEGYGTETQGLREDLDQLGNLLTSYLTLNKADDPLPFASNLDIAAAMRGANPFRMALLPETHPAFNAQGEIADRFGTPIFFHALSQDQIEIRSAGPDRTMWTPDDLQRQPNGSYLESSSSTSKQR